MFQPRKLISFIFVFIILTTNTLAASQNDVNSFLKSQPIIRVFANGGIGFGDLASEANVMTQLRQLGFEGKFEVIYAGKDKVRQLFGLPENIPDSYEDEKNKIHFIYILEFLRQIQNHSVTPVTFSASTMFSPNACHAILDEDPSNEFAATREDTIICKNPANFLNAKIYFDINNWPTISTHYIEDFGTHYYLYNRENNDSFNDTNTYFATNTANLAQSIDYLTNTIDGQSLLLKKPALKLFIDGIQNKTIDVLPVYGWGIKNDPAFGDQNYARNMLQIILSARYAQLNGPVTLRNKPLVIAVFYHYSDEANLLYQFINTDNWGDWNPTDADQARKAIKALQLKDRFSIASLDDAASLDSLKQLKAGDILLLSVGSLPKVVFDGLYTHTDENVWTPIREGAGTFSSLLLTGKPHFRCGHQLVGNEGELWEMNLDVISDLDLRSRMKQLYSASDGFCENQTANWQQQGKLYLLLGQLMIDAHDPNSAFSTYFQTIQKEAMKIENNRVYQAVKKTIEIFQVSDN